jgi:hypothetical protein
LATPGENTHYAGRADRGSVEADRANLPRAA